MMLSVWGVVCAFLFFAACNKAVSQVDIDQNDLVLSVDESYQLTAKVFPENASVKTVTWSSSDEQIVSVSNEGAVTAVKAGKAAVTARSGDQSDAITITVATPIVDGAANCYIISASGIYSFKTVQGNSSKSVGSVASAALLWESFGTDEAPAKGDIIAGLTYYNGTIAFTTPSSLKDGNALIAAKDADNNILWSWHIWVCKDYDPDATAQTYNNGAGKMMDRNLGATSATPGDVGALGLMYQWGRKDPFLGSSSVSSSSTAASTLQWPDPVGSNDDTGTIDYAVAHPTTFIKGGGSMDWLVEGDNNLWKSAKTIYDPCPPGWRVPEGGSNGVWAKAADETDDFSCQWNSDSKGMNFSGKFGSDENIWYPAAGYLGYNVGSLDNVGSRGSWWSCTPVGNKADRLIIQDNGNVGPAGINARSVGNAIRCFKD